MGFLDRLRQQASELADRAQEQGRNVQAKVEDLKDRGKVERLLRQLGLAAYAQRTGQGGAETVAEIDRLVDEISALQEEDEGRSRPTEARAQAEAEAASAAGLAHGQDLRAARETPVALPEEAVPGQRPAQE